ncbi:MAG TPA: N-ethylammeline chlorohydrolase, partial [Firmicutes bacterium]|nr:N-ethylammeline chlorohydrolase [Bacillota bacterium]
MESILLKGPWVAGAGIADVGVRDGKIVLVGTAVAEDCYDRVIPAADCALIPGLVNCHGHAAMTLFRGIADDLPLMPWLEERIWPLEARLTADCVYWGSMLAIAEMIRGGTTTFTDMYFFEEQTARAAAETGIR